MWRIFLGAPFKERANGSRRRKHPPGLVTREVANSFKAASKWPPLGPRWFMARGVRRVVAELWMGDVESASLVNVLFFASRVTKSELVDE